MVWYAAKRRPEFRPIMGPESNSSQIGGFNAAPCEPICGDDNLERFPAKWVTGSREENAAIQNHRASLPIPSEARL
jgi:hypothetical protein